MLYCKSLYLHYLLLLRSFILSIWRVVLEKYGNFFRILLQFLLTKLVLKYGDLCCTSKKLLWVGYCICIIPSSGLLEVQSQANTLPSSYCWLWSRSLSMLLHKSSYCKPVRMLFEIVMEAILRFQSSNKQGRRKLGWW